MKHTYEDGKLTLFLEGRVDYSTVAQVEEDINALLAGHEREEIIMDCTGLVYIASAGLRVLLKVGKRVRKMTINNVSRDIYEIFDMTGFTGMFDTHRILREISVEGLPVIGGGFSSTVYRVDRETALKVYSERITLDRINRETASAKKSFVAGIPTAIPYDVVRVGKCYGTVFELIDADTLSQNFMDHPERFNELMVQYVGLLKQFHATPALNGTFPSIRAKYHEWIGGLAKYMTPDELAKLDELVDAVPDRKTMVHVDCHSRNIMVQDNKLLFVDMADVSIGHPLFDIGAEYFHYVIMRETPLGAKVVFGVEPEDTELPVRVWNALVDGYFADVPREKMDDVRKMLYYFGGLRCLILVAKHSQINREDGEALVNRERRDLLPFIEEAKALFARADEFFL